MPYAWYIFLLVLSQAVLSGLMAFLLTHHRAPAVRWLLPAFGIAWVQIASIIGEILSLGIDAKQHWIFLRYGALPFLPWCYLGVALHLTGFWSARWRRLMLLLLALPVANAAMAWLPPLQELLLRDPRLLTASGWNYLQMSPGPFLQAHVLFSYGVLLVTVAILALRALRPTGRCSRITALGVAALLFAPMVVSGAFMVWGVTCVPGYNLAPVLYLASHLTFVALIWRGHLLQLTPLARHAAVAAMPQPVLALDAMSQVIDRNPAAGILGDPIPAALLADPPPAEWRQGDSIFLVTSASVERRGRALGRVLLLVDVTALRAAMDRAAAADAAKSRFLAMMSHEIRTPLNGVVGYAQLLGRSSLAGREREAVEAIVGCGEHLARLVGDLLDIARIEAGHVDLRAESVVVEELLRQAVAPSRARADSRGLVLSWRIGERTPARIIADPLRLAQIVGNLVANAVKFTASGRIDIHVGVEGAWLRVAVSDTGCGIAPADRQRLFVPFSQLDHSEKRQGLGLGLAISHGLATAMGGTLTVESVPGSGSTFTLRIPLQAGTPDADPVPAHARRLRVLVAEDDERSRRLLTAVCADAGHAVESVADGEAAWRALAAGPFDVALIDGGLPGIAGLDIAARLRGRPRPFLVAVTADALVSDRARYLDGGFDAYLAKPIDLQALETLLRDR